MRLLIVIVNYKTAALTVDCLRALVPQLTDDMKVVVTDNASGDNSVKIIGDAIESNRWARHVTLLPLPRNGGFAYGNNEGIHAFGGHKPELVYLLNPDTIPLPGAVDELVRFMDAHPACGIAGGRAENRDGTVRRSSFRFITVLGELEGVVRFGPVSRVLKRFIVAPPTPDGPQRCDWVSGASMMVRREVFEKIGLLDDSYFMYYEETDFCLRAVRAGFEVWYVPASRIIHLVGQSSGVTGTQRAAKRRPKYWFDSRRLYFRKGFGRFKAEASNLLWLGAFPVSRALQVVRRQPRVDPPMLWWDFFRYNFLPWHRKPWRPK